ARKCDLCLGGAVDVVEGRARCAALSDVAQVLDGVGPGQCPAGAVQGGTGNLDERSELVKPRASALDPCHLRWPSLPGRPAYPYGPMNRSSRILSPHPLRPENTGRSVSVS